MAQLKRVDMREFEVGDCWKCCLATILGLSYSQVPHFRKKYGAEDRMKKTVEWLYVKHSITLVSLAGLPLNLDLRPQAAADAPFYYIVTGVSPRTKSGRLFHSVIYEGSNMVFDPHPSRAGILMSHLTSHILV